MAAKSVAMEISALLSPEPEPEGDNGGDGGGVANKVEEEIADFLSEAGAGLPGLPDGVGGVSWLAILSSSLPLGLTARPDLRGSSIGADITSEKQSRRKGTERGRTTNERSNNNNN
jgi:hypothetical protein